MAKYRETLPQLSKELFLTDGGIETTLIFDEGLDLPYFAAFDLLKHTAGQAVLRKYFQTYAEIAPNMPLVSSSKARLGGRVPIGARNWVTPLTLSPLPIARRSCCCTLSAVISKASVHP